MKTAVSMPALMPNATPEQKQQAFFAAQNLQTHLVAVPPNQAPANIAYIRNLQLANYTNNYPLFLNNQRCYVTRGNTFVNQVEPNFYPEWYTPQHGWLFCNGFTLGSLPMANLNWLQSGWQPYWGPPPEGFVCESEYMPTPWIYFPALNQWRQPGYPTFVDYGPPLDYTGPITVAILEPVHYRHHRVINELYFYNAYFYPEFERWGYTNYRGYFIWLNI
jgi:hypothetical protein